MRKPGSPASLLFRLIIPVTALFIITILALIATLFGDDRAPVAQFINQYGNSLLIIEFLAIVALTLAAMTADRLATLKQLQKNPPKSGSDTSG
jgi:hypothetical protein